MRAGLLVGGERAVVWDTLAHPSQMEAVAALAGRRPLTVVYSHADWDHAWGTCALAGVEAVVAHARAAERFGSDVPEELHRRRTREPGVWDGVRLVPPTETFTRLHTLDLGGATLELHALPGHTPDCLVGFVPEWGVLLAGDTVETPLPVVNDAEAVSAWIAELDLWRADERVHVVVPSHGPVGGRELLSATLAYLRGLGSGKAPEDLAALPEFYLETHRRNLERAGSASGP